MVSAMCGETSRRDPAVLPLRRMGAPNASTRVRPARGVPVGISLPQFAAICRAANWRKVRKYLWLKGLAILQPRAHNPEVAGSSPAPAIERKVC